MLCVRIAQAKLSQCSNSSFQPGTGCNTDRKLQVYRGATVCDTGRKPTKGKQKSHLLLLYVYMVSEQATRLCENIQSM